MIWKVGKKWILNFKIIAFERNMLEPKTFYFKPYSTHLKHNTPLSYSYWGSFFNPISIFFARPCVFTSFFTGNFSQLNKIGFRRSLLASKRFFVKTWQWTALCWTKRAEQASGWDDTCYAFSNMYVQSALPYFLQHSIQYIPKQFSYILCSNFAK